MKAMMLTGIRRMETMQVPAPVIRRDDEVLLRLGSIGVCGSDIHYYTHGRIGSQVVQYPYRVGHECSAIVEAVGSAVTRVKPGSRVAVDPAVWCGTCDQCRVGRFHTCRALTFLGCPGQADGCMAEFLVMPERSLFPVPDSMSLEIAALVEPLSIGLYAVEQSIPMAGAAIAILGAGPIGLSVMLAARSAGARTIYVTDKIDARLAAAARAGADWTGNPDNTDIVAAIGDREPLALDAVFECCGRQEALDQAVNLLKPGGKLMLIGIPTEDRVSFAIDTLRRRELDIQNVRRQNECVEKTIALVAEGRMDPGFMITHRFPFDRSKEAFDLVDAYRDGIIKAMVNLNA